MTAVWTRLRPVLALAALLLGTLAPAHSLSPPARTAVWIAGGVIAVGWFASASRWDARVATAGLALIGIGGVVVSVLAPQGAALAFPIIALVRAGALWPRRWAYAYTALLGLGYVVGVLLPGPDSVIELLVPAGFVIAVLAGRGRQQNARLAAQAERDRARAAALDERARIAREIHDILAHSLAALSVQLETADALLDSGRVAGAQESVRRAGQLAREGLTETRRAIGALRGDAVPLPELLDALVAAYRSDVDVAATVTVSGEPRTLEPDAALALYRTAQEALTNAHKHAPGAPVRILLGYESGEVRLAVENGAPRDGAERPLAAAGGGYGLAGLRERAELAGGSLVAGPAGDGYRVGVTIPA